MRQQLYIKYKLGKVVELKIHCNLTTKEFTSLFLLKHEIKKPQVQLLSI